jgi:hypothetical protein
MIAFLIDVSSFNQVLSFFCKHKKHNNYLCNFPPSWYLSTLPCQKITLKHFFFVFFLTQKQSSITPSSALRGLLQTYKISLRFFLSLFLSFSLSPNVSLFRGRKTVRKEGREQCSGTPLSTPFNGHEPLKRAKQRRQNTTQTLFCFMPLAIAPLKISPFLHLFTQMWVCISV